MHALAREVTIAVVARGTQSVHSFRLSGSGRPVILALVAFGRHAMARWQAGTDGRG